MHNLKYIMLGNSGCGKSSIMNRYIHSTFDKDMKTTIGIEYSAKMEMMGGNRFKVQIFDLAGQDRFRSIVRSYYRKCDSIILVFDLSDRNSFDSIGYWYEEIEKVYSLVDENEYLPKIILLGNKIDKCDLRCVEDKEIKEFMKRDMIIKYEECSAKTGYNIAKSFEYLNQKVYKNLLKHNMIEYELEVESIVIEDCIKKKKCCL